MNASAETTPRFASCSAHRLWDGPTSTLTSTLTSPVAGCRTGPARRRRREGQEQGAETENDQHDPEHRVDQRVAHANSKREAAHPGAGRPTDVLCGEEWVHRR